MSARVLHPQLSYLGSIPNLEFVRKLDRVVYALCGGARKVQVGRKPLR